MPNDIDEQIRTKAGLIISTAYATARVYPWNALSHDLAEWPGLFRMAAGGTHGWIIKRTGTQGEWNGSGGRTRRYYKYDIFGFYGFRTGKLGDNSDDEFGEILDTVFEAFRSANRLNLDGTVEEHELLQWQRITTINCGEETLHFAQGFLKVMLCH